MGHPLGQASPQSPTYKGLGPICEAALKGECHNLRTGGYRSERRVIVTGYSRTISLIDLPLTKNSRRIRATVSTTSIPFTSSRAKHERLNQASSGGQFWTPITPQQGSIFHADSHLKS